MSFPGALDDYLHKFFLDRLLILNILRPITTIDIILIIKRLNDKIFHQELELRFV